MIQDEDDYILLHGKKDGSKEEKGKGKEEEKKKLVQDESIQQENQLNELMNNLSSVDELIVFLKSEMPTTYDESISLALRKYGIDGYSFQEFGGAYLRELELTLPLGTKLHLVSKARRVQRAMRMKRRNVEIMRVECKLFPPGVDKTTCIMTHSCLKFKFSKIDIKDIPNGKKRCYCYGKEGNNNVKTTMRMIDHVDLSLIEDVDFQQVISTKVTTTTGLLPCWNKTIEQKDEDKKIYVFISLALKEEILDILEEGEKSQRTSILKLQFKDTENAENFKNALIGACEQVQSEEGNRYS